MLLESLVGKVLGGRLPLGCGPQPVLRLFQSYLGCSSRVMCSMTGLSVLRMASWRSRFVGLSFVCIFFAFFS